MPLPHAVHLTLQAFRLGLRRGLRREGNDGLTRKERAAACREWEETVARRPTPEELATLKARLHQRTAE